MKRKGLKEIWALLMGRRYKGFQKLCITSSKCISNKHTHSLYFQDYSSLPTALGSIRDVKPEAIFCECRSQTREASTYSVEFASTAAQIKLRQQVLDGCLGGIRRLQTLYKLQLLNLPDGILRRHSEDNTVQQCTT
jgi:hypothetical protein